MLVKMTVSSTIKSNHFEINRQNKKKREAVSKKYYTSFCTATWYALLVECWLEGDVKEPKHLLKRLGDLVSGVVVYL